MLHEQLDIAHWKQVFSVTRMRAEGQKNEFTFSAQEQQHWYEELKFWVQSYPAQCLACRRKRRERNQAAQTLQKKLKELPEHHLQEPQHLLEIASLYLKIGSYRKANEYLARAQKRVRERGELTALADQIESLKQQIPED